jgi:hypothetical protein
LPLSPTLAAGTTSVAVLPLAALLQLLPPLLLTSQR